MHCDKRNAYRDFLRKPEGKRPLGGSRRGWKNNNKMDLEKLDGVILTGYIWLRIGTSEGHL
jgi:hypothetical protein